jgi:hypothetical protein
MNPFQKKFGRNSATVIEDTANKAIKIEKEALSRYREPNERNEVIFHQCLHCGKLYLEGDLLIGLAEITLPKGSYNSNSKSGTDNYCVVCSYDAYHVEYRSMWSPYHWLFRSMFNLRKGKFRALYQFDKGKER